MEPSGQGVDVLSGGAANGQAFIDEARDATRRETRLQRGQQPPEVAHVQLRVVVEEHGAGGERGGIGAAGQQRSGQRKFATRVQHANR